MADGAVDALLEQGVQPRARGQRQVVAKTEVRQHQPHGPVDGPGMEPPVKEGDLHRLTRGGGRAADLGRGLEVVLQRLAHAKVHEADAHARRKQHGGPGDEAEIGHGIVRPQADVTVAAEGDQHQKGQEQRHGDRIEPVKVPNHPGLRAREQLLGALRIEAAKHQQRTEHQQRGHHHGGHQRDARGRGACASGWRGLRRG